ncbi:hypothetical protein FHX42_001246 [Saccharopolyspora lacisalsi]|uniref:Uncharacterized protein n=1 Tax=Halosaccharopolyspora lacisalsi TaxID=1000566 RepID=A0A839DWU3_9PSEU|nr:hypothetical protein [Halosaccharopolyspora lacisalsi]MBA8823917.1 hypothetical protein [Halosaccharopolyspora lacisalsi]
MARWGGPTWGAVTRLDRGIVAHPWLAALSTTGGAGGVAVLLEVLTPASRTMGLGLLPVLALVSYLLLFLPMSKHYRRRPPRQD